jgi:Bifunctional DNA primase/polymerase, N-terminal
MNRGAEQFAGTRNEPENCEKDLGAFARAAETLWRAGLVPIPVGGEDGKKPLVTSFTKWKRRPGLSAIKKWIIKYPGANVGVVTGRYLGCVVDIHSAVPLVQQQLVERFGNTPFKTQTPRGGCHLWYRTTDAACHRRSKFGALVRKCGEQKG